MAAKPADFFVGVVDFFAVLLPGAILSFACLGFAEEHIFGHVLRRLEGETAGWTAFAIASYVLGHFSSQLGAAGLDRVYNWTYLRVKKRGRGNDLFRYVNEIKARALMDRNHIAEPYKWAQTQVRIRSESAMQEIDRLEADSKFFRNITVVLIAFPFVTMGRSDMDWIRVTVVVALSIFSFLRFSYLRWKCGEAAFLTLVALEKTVEQGKSIGTTA